MFKGFLDFGITHGEREQWAVYYTSPQGFIIMLLIRWLITIGGLH